MEGLRDGGIEGGEREARGWEEVVLHFSQRNHISCNFSLTSNFPSFFHLVDILLLFWGILLCYTVRKAPTKFNESKYISLSIYNMTVFTIIIKLLK